MIATIAEKNSSAIEAIDGLHMIDAIAEKVNEGLRDLGVRLTHRSRHSIRQIQHGGCESSIPA